LPWQTETAGGGPGSRVRQRTGKTTTCMSGGGVGGGSSTAGGGVGGVGGGGSSSNSGANDSVQRGAAGGGSSSNSGANDSSAQRGVYWKRNDSMRLVHLLIDPELKPLFLAIEPQNTHRTEPLRSAGDEP